MGNAENPVPMLAMLKHLANVQEKEAARSTWSTPNCCRSCWTPWRPNPRQTADEYLDKLVSEFETVEAEEAKKPPKAMCWLLPTPRRPGR